MPHGTASFARAGLDRVSTSLNRFLPPKGVQSIFTACACCECCEKTQMDGWMDTWSQQCLCLVAVCQRRQEGGASLLSHSQVFWTLYTSVPLSIKALARTLIPLMCKGNPFLLQLYHKQKGTNAAFGVITWVNLTKYETNEKQRANRASFALVKSRPPQQDLTTHP